MLPPINVNVGPTQSSQPSDNFHDRTEIASFDQADSDIPEPIEVAVEEYTNWHLAKVSTNNFKDNIQEARDICLITRPWATF